MVLVAAGIAAFVVASFLLVDGGGKPPKHVWLLGGEYLGAWRGDGFDIQIAEGTHEQTNIYTFSNQNEEGLLLRPVIITTKQQAGAKTGLYRGKEYDFIPMGGQNFLRIFRRKEGLFVSFREKPRLWHELKEVSDD